MFEFGHYSNAELGIRRDITCAQFERRGVNLPLDISCSKEAFDVLSLPRAYKEIDSALFDAKYAASQFRRYKGGDPEARQELKALRDKCSAIIEKYHPVFIQSSTSETAKIIGDRGTYAAIKGKCSERLSGLMKYTRMLETLIHNGDVRIKTVEQALKAKFKTDYSYKQSHPYGGKEIVTTSNDYLEIAKNVLRQKPEKIFHEIFDGHEEDFIDYETAIARFNDQFGLIVQRPQTSTENGFADQGYNSVMVNGTLNDPDDYQTYSEIIDVCDQFNQDLASRVKKIIREKVEHRVPTEYDEQYKEFVNIYGTAEDSDVLDNIRESLSNDRYDEASHLFFKFANDAKKCGDMVDLEEYGYYKMERMFKDYREQNWNDSDEPDEELTTWQMKWGANGEYFMEPFKRALKSGGYDAGLKIMLDISNEWRETYPYLDEDEDYDVEGWEEAWELLKKAQDRKSVSSEDDEYAKNSMDEGDDSFYSKWGVNGSKFYNAFVGVLTVEGYEGAYEIMQEVSDDWRDSHGGSEEGFEVEGWEEAWEMYKGASDRAKALQKESERKSKTKDKISEFNKKYPKKDLSKDIMVVLSSESDEGFNESNYQEVSRRIVKRKQAKHGERVRDTLNYIFQFLEDVKQVPSVDSRKRQSKIPQCLAYIEENIESNIETAQPDEMKYYQESKKLIKDIRKKFNDIRR